jgi:hypothetical protein
MWPKRACGASSGEVSFHSKDGSCHSRGRADWVGGSGGSEGRDGGDGGDGKLQAGARGLRWRAVDWHQRFAAFVWYVRGTRFLYSHIILALLPFPHGIPDHYMPLRWSR